jgi:glyoxylase-like metal-dependent hydrolase (beta-lactamase superfamily II)
MTLQSTLFGSHGRVATALLLTASLAGCTGDEGPQGPAGDPGAPGERGENGGFDPATTTPDKAYAGLGGKDALQALTSFSFKAEGNHLILGEGFDARDGSINVSVYESTTQYDVTADAFRIDSQRQFFFIPAERTVSEVVNGDVGFVLGSNSVFVPPSDPPVPVAMLSDQMGALRKELRLLNPQLILQDVAAAPATATEGTPALYNGVLHETLVVTDAVAPITLYVNPFDGTISKLETKENDHLRRDVALEVFYGDWQGAAGQVKYPGAVLLAVDGQLVRAETRSEFQANVAVAGADVAIPTLDPAPVFVEDDATRGMKSNQWLQQFAGLGIPLYGLQTGVVANPLDNAVAADAKVFHLVGGSHNSLAVKQAGGVIIIEAPLYPERSVEILKWVETTFGAGTPVTHVIATHHHFDHSAGLREFVAAGAQVVMQENSRAFFAEIFRAPSTISPDTQSATPKEPSFVTVADGGSRAFNDADASVVAYHSASSHSNDMLIIQVQSSGQSFLFASDIYSPGQPPSPVFAGELYRSITEEHGIDVDVLVGGHGVTAPFSELENFVNPPTAN